MHYRLHIHRLASLWEAELRAKGGEASLYWVVWSFCQSRFLLSILCLAVTQLAGFSGPVSQNQSDQLETSWSHLGNQCSQCCYYSRHVLSTVLPVVPPVFPVITGLLFSLQGLRREASSGVHPAGGVRPGLWASAGSWSVDHRAGPLLVPGSHLGPQLPNWKPPAWGSIEPGLRKDPAAAQRQGPVARPGGGVTCFTLTPPLLTT